MMLMMLSMHKRVRGYIYADLLCSAWQLVSSPVRSQVSRRDAFFLHPKELSCTPHYIKALRFFRKMSTNNQNLKIDSLFNVKDWVAVVTGGGTGAFVVLCGAWSTIFTSIQALA
jgi:hypothetical protein